MGSRACSRHAQTFGYRGPPWLVCGVAVGYGGPEHAVRNAD